MSALYLCDKVEVRLWGGGGLVFPPLVCAAAVALATWGLLHMRRLIAEIAN